MASRLNPYLHFTGEARAAMEFYHSVFGGSLTLTTFAEYGVPDPALADKIMHGQLVTDRGFALMGSDAPPGMGGEPGNSVGICLNGDDADELRGYWEKLSEGATVLTPLQKQMWGDEYGACTDRYGFEWMVNIG
jgi:PhnB protein